MLNSYEQDYVSRANEIKAKVQAKDKKDSDPFKVTNNSSASWTLKMLTSLNKQLDEVQKTADKERANIQEWEDNEKERIETSISYFESLIEKYYSKKLKEEGEDFKINTPHGKVSTRKGRDKWKYNDEQKIVDWLKENKYHDFYKIQEKLKKREFKQNFEVVEGKVVDTNTGEIVDGVEVEDGEVKMIIKLN